MTMMPPDKLLHNWLKQSASRFQLIESLPVWSNYSSVIFRYGLSAFVLA